MEIMKDEQLVLLIIKLYLIFSFFPHEVLENVSKDISFIIISDRKAEHLTSLINRLPFANWKLNRVELSWGALVPCSGKVP